jgi:hypothetical protein
MTDFLPTYAAQLDAEPDCRCTSTDRETDTLGCELHSTEEDEWRGTLW